MKFQGVAKTLGALGCTHPTRTLQAPTKETSFLSFAFHIMPNFNQVLISYEFVVIALSS